MEEGKRSLNHHHRLRFVGTSEKKGGGGGRGKGGGDVFDLSERTVGGRERKKKERKKGGRGVCPYFSHSLGRPEEPGPKRREKERGGKRGDRSFSFKPTGLCVVTESKKKKKRKGEKKGYFV